MERTPPSTDTVDALLNGARGRRLLLEYALASEHFVYPDVAHAGMPANDVLYFATFDAEIRIPIE